MDTVILIIVCLSGGMLLAFVLMGLVILSDSEARHDLFMDADEDDNPDITYIKEEGSTQNEVPNHKTK